MAFRDICHCIERHKNHLLAASRSHFMLAPIQRTDSPLIVYSARCRACGNYFGRQAIDNMVKLSYGNSTIAKQGTSCRNRCRLPYTMGTGQNEEKRSTRLQHLSMRPHDIEIFRNPIPKSLISCRVLFAQRLTY